MGSVGVVLLCDPESEDHTDECDGKKAKKKGIVGREWKRVAGTKKKMH